MATALVCLLGLAIWLAFVFLVYHYVTLAPYVVLNLRGALAERPPSAQDLEAQVRAKVKELEVQLRKDAWQNTEEYKEESEQVYAVIADAMENIESEHRQHEALKLKFWMLENEYKRLQQQLAEEPGKVAAHPNDIEFVPTHLDAPKGRGIIGSTWPPPDPRELARLRLSSNGEFPLKQPTAYCRGRVGLMTHKGKMRTRDADKDLLDHIHVVPDNADGRTLFCGIYTHAAEHAAGPLAVHNTWASRCDGFVALSDKDDPAIPAVKVTHLGPEHYVNMWQKIRSVWKYIHWAYSSHFDWFMLGGDDIMVIPSNLRAYLKSQEIIGASSNGSKPLFLGRRFALKTNRTRHNLTIKQEGKTYNSGGAGYVLNRLALKILVDHLESPECDPIQLRFDEDVLIAQCLDAARGIQPYDTRDRARPLGFYQPGVSEKRYRERFHPFAPSNHLLYSKNKDDWYKEYNPWGLGWGYNCCSELSVSFHYMLPDMMARAAALLWDCREPQQSHLSATGGVKIAKPIDREIRHLTWPPPDPRQLARQRLAMDNSSKQSRELCESKGLQGGTREDRELLDSLTVDPDNDDGHTLLCIVYTIGKTNVVGGHKSSELASQRTWGSYCDGFVAFPSVAGSTSSLVVVDPARTEPEEESELRQKVRSIWKYVQWAYSGRYDWFMLVADENFIIAPNLRAYLKSDEIIHASLGGSKPLFLGRRSEMWKGFIINSGGAGYVLNKAALNVLVTNFHSPKCNQLPPSVAADAYVANCLANSGGVFPHDTRDHTHAIVALGGSGYENRERFHIFTPGMQLLWRETGPSQNHWYNDFNKAWGLGMGYECCSEHSVSFRATHEMMPHMFALLFKCRH